MNEIIKPYMHQRYMINLRLEFIELSQSSNQPCYLASPDVESLFTNVPVTETVNVIIEHCYKHPSCLPPDIPKTLPSVNSLLSAQRKLLSEILMATSTYTLMEFQWVPPVATGVFLNFRSLTSEQYT